MAFGCYEMMMRMMENLFLLGWLGSACLSRSARLDGCCCIPFNAFFHIFFYFIQNNSQRIPKLLFSPLLSSRQVHPEPQSASQYERKKNLNINYESC
jgi:hypothetical protein